MLYSPSSPDAAAVAHARVCCHCGQDIPMHRLRRPNAFFCSPECRKLDRKERNALRALSVCRLCGRRKRSRESRKRHGESVDAVQPPSETKPQAARLPSKRRP